MLIEESSMKKIFVTKSFLPPLDEYVAYLEKIWQNNQLTNQGLLLQELEAKMKEFLQVENFHFLTNGTLALQLALSALDINEGEVITTPFSYVATSSSILWQKCKPVFVDIEKDNFTIDVNKIEEAITKKTRAIMPVHVFGYACDVEKIQEIADKYNLKIIYDAAHAFGVKYKNKSLLSYGDISTLSFHATKLFQTIEGGACIVKNKEISDRLELQKRFGHEGNNHNYLGINAKANEFQAAMGLANFPYIEEIIQSRKKISDLYDSLLQGLVQRPLKQENLEYNYAYYPALFPSDKKLSLILRKLNQFNIFPRRYFYPSLNTIEYISGNICPVSEDISTRIACLPLSHDLAEEIIVKICKVIKEEL